MAPSTTSILAGKYPAKSHITNVLDYLRSHLSSSSSVPSSALTTSLIYLESAHQHMNEDNDQEAPFRQRRYFYYLTGCELPDCAYVYDTKEGKSTLFIPPIVPDEVVWSGLPVSVEEASKRYDVDEVRTTDEVSSFMSSHSSSKEAIFAIQNQISDQINISDFKTNDTSLLKEAIEECRVIKDDYEIALTRKANHVSAIAHKAVMKHARHAKNERELAGIFYERCMANGCHTQAYSSIVASGTDASTLHYVKNNKDLTSSTLNILLDAGGEYNCYAADITRTFPISGKFSRESRDIYALVLKMQKDCMDMIKAGVLWDDVHVQAHHIAIDGLLALGILKGDREEVFESRTSVAFFPHGLGHYLGMDTHDTGGHANYSDPDPMFRYLRVRGRLPAGSIITVEPGIYFCRFMIKPALKKPEQAKFIDEEVLGRYWEVGGVRIEDDVLVTGDGFVDLTEVPKEIDELESLITG